MKTIKLLLLSIFLLKAQWLIAEEIQINFTDSSNNEIVLDRSPERIVSLVPSVTEMLLQLGVEEQLIGITLHDTRPVVTSEKSVVGGFFDPDLERIVQLEPDTIFYAPLQEGIREKFTATATLIHLAPSTIEDSFAHLRLLGSIFNKEKRAEEIISEQQRQLAIIQQKTAKIQEDKRVRVVRLMGRDQVKVPGDDSFQNEYIKHAGGIAPKFGENGAIIQPTVTAWQRFNPQVIYGCGGDREVLPLLKQAGWKDVDAVRNNKIFFFPCELTCRVSTHTGYFVSWLSARLYENEFSNIDNLVLESKIVERKKLELGLEYVESAEKIYSDIFDFRNNSLLIHLKEPMTILSTLEGWRSGVGFVGNHYMPPPSWGLGHSEGLDGLRERSFPVLGVTKEKSSMLFTGANIENLAIATTQYKNMKVVALVTAGVQSNAVRMSKDIGSWYELKEDEKSSKKNPGTINTLILTNTKLSNRAMTRAVISAVEAKTAALQDLDIRSSATPIANSATGTGTDNVLVVQGRGADVENCGGHSKMGELIAKAVYQGVKEAIAMQNGISEKRSVFARLKDRKTSGWKLSRLCGCGPKMGRKLEKLLLDPEYAGFLKAAFALSDNYERGLIEDLTSFDRWCAIVASQVAGKEIMVTDLADRSQPLVMRKALGALISGLQEQ